MEHEEDGREDDVLDEEVDLSGEEDSEDDEDDASSVGMIFDDDDEDDVEEDLMIQIGRNDALLKIININNSYDPPDGWEAFGESIGRNTMLNEVNIIYQPLSVLGVKFYRGLAKNRSIKRLKFCSNRVCGEILLYLIPFFMKNKSFESLDILYDHYSGLPSGGRFDSLEYALEQFNGLKELRVCSDRDGIDGAGKVIKALSDHTGLRKLHLGGVQIGKEGFANLAAMLLNPSCSLSTLSLDNQFDFDDEMANVLSSGLNGNNTLTELGLSGSFGQTCTVTAIGWKAIFDPLKSTSCMINTLNLGTYKISDTALHCLISALSNNNNIKVLNLQSKDNRHSILQAIFHFLQSPSCMLESIHLFRDSFDDEKMESLANALANNCRLKKLQLCWNTSITPVGWQTLFQLLQRPSCRLESLDFRGNYLTNETVQYLASVISNGCRLRELNLAQNRRVSLGAWQVLVHALRIHAPALEMLGLSTPSMEYIHYGLIASITDLLINNHTLKILTVIDAYTDRKIYNGYVAAVTRIVFDKSSILNTYNSNHIIEELCNEQFYSLPPELSSLLRINKENSMNQAARIKIIKAHFSGSNINTQVFNHMELNVHPIAIEWMGGSNTNDLLFAYLRGLPSICDVKRKIKKRKANDAV
jgi:Ran GTPase-activating protein (RanGAP) involved in mRNA processing and transport